MSDDDFLVRAVFGEIDHVIHCCITSVEARRSKGATLRLASRIV